MARGIEEQMTIATDRAEIVRRFEVLLDSALAGEDPPAGIGTEILESVLRDSSDSNDDTASSRQCDSYALWAAMTALTPCADGCVLLRFQNAIRQEGPALTSARASTAAAQASRSAGSKRAAR